MPRSTAVGIIRSLTCLRYRIRKRLRIIVPNPVDSRPCPTYHRLPSDRPGHLPSQRTMVVPIGTPSLSIAPAALLCTRVLLVDVLVVPPQLSHTPAASRPTRLVHVRHLPRSLRGPGSTLYPPSHHQCRRCLAPHLVGQCGARIISVQPAAYASSTTSPQSLNHRDLETACFAIRAAPWEAANHPLPHFLRHISSSGCIKIMWRATSRIARRPWYCPVCLHRRSCRRWYPSASAASVPASAVVHTAFRHRYY